MNKIIKSTIIVSFIRIFDMVTTYLGVKKFGIEGELNPLLNLEMGIFGSLEVALMFHYLAGIVLVYLALLLIDYLQKKDKKTKKEKVKISTWILSIIFLAAAINNIFQLI